MLSFIPKRFRKTLLLGASWLILGPSAFAQVGTWAGLTHTATHTNAGGMLLLTDGTVLCKSSSGGSDGTVFDRLTPDATGSYKNGTWTSIAAMHYPRLYFSGQVLPDGRVYVCGGEYGTGGKYGEVWDPKTNVWTITGGATWVFPNTVSDANSELLPDGTVLQASVDESGVNWNYIWNPTANTYTRTANCLRIDNEAVWIKLPDSSVLFLDNYDETSERYEYRTGTWINDATAGEDLYDPYGSEAGAGFLLPNGQVWFIGSTPTSLYYTPSGSTTPGTWTNGPNLPDDTAGAPDAASAMMPNGHILMALSHTPTSSSNDFPSPTQYWEFDYTTNTYTLAGAPGGGTYTDNAAYISNMLVLPDGNILFANQGDNQYYVYTPGSGPLPAGQPTIAAVNRVNCDTFQITGTLFNGITEGAAYGDDWQMSTNYPIVRLSSGTNIYYATVYNWNRIGAVMTGSLPDTAIFKLPAGLAAGTYSVTVIANGNPSAPFTLNTSLTITPTPVTVCIGGTTTLSDSSSIGHWSTANSTIASIGSASGILNGLIAGTTTVSYTIGQCYSTAVATVNPLPPAILGTPAMCPGSATTLSDAATGGTWSSSNANATAGSSSGSITGITSGTSVITYTAPTGCATSIVTTVYALPAAAITASGTTTFCLGSNVTLNGTAGTGFTYQWQLGGANISGATSASYVASTGGNYTVIITNANGCSDTSAATTVTTTSGPTATITPAGPTTFCTGGSVVLNANTGTGLTYQWQLGGTNISGATLSSYTATLGGNYTVIVTQGICYTTSSATLVTVNSAPTVLPITGASSVCTGLTTMLSDATTPGTWSSSDVTTASVGVATGIVTGMATGTAIISYTYTNTCGSISTTKIMTVNTSTVVDPITGPTALCVGNTSVLSDGTTPGLWSSSNTAVANISASGIVTGAAAGTASISYTYTNAAGCINSAGVTVTVSAPFSASISPLSSTTFCTGGYVTLDATTGSGYTYQWEVGGVTISGATNAYYTTSSGGNYTAIISSPTGCTVATGSTTVVVNSSSIVVPSVTISSSFGDTVCVSASPSTFTATPVNGGTAPNYKWYVNGVLTGTGNTYTYLPASGDIVKAVLISNDPCAFPDSAMNSITMTVAPEQTAAVSITSVHNDSTCTGDTVQFAAVPVYGGTAPTYLWTENGVNVATGPYYVYAPNNGDTLVVTMTSNYPCLAANPVASNVFIIHAFTPTVNNLSVSVSQSSITTGSVDTFTAIATGAGSSPAFQWYINGNPIAGATSNRYITDSLQDGQVVNCEETSSFACAEPPSVTSGGITISVVRTGIAQVGANNDKFTLVPNPNNGAFTIHGSLSSPADNQVNIVVTDVLGQAIYKKTAFANNGNINEQVLLPNTIAAGTYQVSVTSGADHVVFHVLIEK